MNNKSANEFGARGTLKSARDAYRKLSEALEHAIEGMVRGKTADHETMAIVRLHILMMQKVLDAEEDLEKRARHIEPSGSSSLDLEAARAEIARRLARLTSAGGS